jgi:hypothetical protein
VLSHINRSLLPIKPKRRIPVLIDPTDRVLLKGNPMLNIKTTAIAAITAFALAASAAAPANAFGSNERKFLQGVAAAVIVGTVINQSKRSRNKAQPQYQQPQQQYQQRRNFARPAPQAYASEPQRGRVIGSNSSNQSSGLYQTPSARAFNSYSPNERRAIQRRLSAFGYYDGTIDGAFGPRTHQALYAFARTANKQTALDSTQGAFSVIDALLG